MNRNEKLLHQKLRALTPTSNGKKNSRQGRPPDGFQKALKYSSEVGALRAAGIPSWRAITLVAEQNRKTPGHIASCVRRIDNEASFDDLWEIDETEV